MFRTKGKIEFIYNNTRKQVDYSFCNLGGTPTFDFNDVRGYNHQFRKLHGIGWRSALNKEPSWPKDFLLVLYAAFELEFQFICTSHRELKGQFDGI